MKFLLDTDICIYLLKRQPLVLAQFTQHRMSDIGISAITVAELEYGVAKSGSTKNKRTLASWLALLQQPPFDIHASSTYGRVRAELELKGTPIGPLDTLIASHALALGLTLVTNNVREFNRISGLKIENWTAP